VRTLARLWQLQSKMESVVGVTVGYQARIERVTAARRNIEERWAGAGEGGGGLCW
jgi:hypothetical protein